MEYSIVEYYVDKSIEERKLLTYDALGNIDDFRRYIRLMKERLKDDTEGIKYVTNTTRIGIVRVRGVARGVPYPNVKGFTNIPAWSRGAAPYKQLSPFFIGPVIYEEYGEIKKCAIFENFWQSFKVYSRVDKQNKKEWKWNTEVHITNTNDKVSNNNDSKVSNNSGGIKVNDVNPNSNWFKWHNALCSNQLAVRRPNGKVPPLYSYFNGRKLGLFEARKEIYIKYLQELYRNSNVYRDLRRLVMNGTNIILLEPDGPSIDLFPDGMEVNLDLLYKLQDVSKMHEFVTLTNNGVRSITSTESDNASVDGNKYVGYGHGYVIALTILEDLNY